MATKKTVQKANQLEAKVDINISSSSKTVRADEYRSVYVNNVQFGFSRFDFQVICAQNIVSRDPAYKDTLKETVSLLMTPAYAKAFVTDMARVIIEHEEKYGSIEMPPPLT